MQQTPAGEKRRDRIKGVREQAGSRQLFRGSAQNGVRKQFFRWARSLRGRTQRGGSQRTFACEEMELFQRPSPGETNWGGVRGTPCGDKMKEAPKRYRGGESE